MGKRNDIDTNRNFVYDPGDKDQDTCCHNDSLISDNALPVPRLRLNISCIVVFILSISCFWITQYGDFYFDDSTAIKSNKDIRTDTPFMNIFSNDFWGTRLLSNSSHKSYRPLTVLTYRWNYAFGGGLHPWGFHMVNVILYGICSVYLLRIFSTIIGGFQLDEDGKMIFMAPKASFLCAVLFAVHPIHTESVAAVVGRADLICMFFYCTSFISYVKFANKDSSLLASYSDLAISLLSATAAMFAKEQGVTVLGVCIAYDVIMVAQITPNNICDWWKGKQVEWKVNMMMFIRRMLFVVAAIVLLLFVRLTIMGFTPKFQYQDNPASFQSSFIIRVLNYNYLYSLNIWLLLNPWWLCFDWAMGCVPVITSVSDVRLLAPLVMVVGFVMVCWKVMKNMETEIGRCFAMSLAFFVIPFIPATNIFFRVGFVVAERNLFISSVGFVMMVVVGCIVMSSTECGEKFIRVGMLFLIGILAARSVHRAYDWLDEIRLFASGVKVCPLNAKVHYNIGKSNQDKGNIDISISAYHEAIRLWPDYDQPMNNLGNIYKDRKMFKEAEYHLERAVNITTNFHIGWMNLANVKADMKKKEEAIHCFTQAVSHKRVYPDAYYNWGNLHLSYDEHELALEKFNMAIRQKPDHKMAWKNKILLLGNMGKAEELLRTGKEVVKMFPTDDHIHNTVSNSLGSVGRLKDAEKFAKKAMQFNPSNYEAASILGIIYHRLERYEEADKYYKIALQGNPDNKAVKANYAKLRSVWKK